MSIPQRAYVYLAAFVAFAILLQGAFGLATDLAGGLTGLVSSGGADATWIAMIIVGLPVWAAHALIIRRAAAAHSEEAGSVLRKMYVHGALALSSLYVFFGARYAAQGILGEVDGIENLAGVAAALALWYYLWRTENVEGQPTQGAQTVKRWHVYGLCVIFLTAGVTATFMLTYGVLDTAYALLFGEGDTLVSVGDFVSPLRGAASWAIVGIAAWAVQWRAVATSDEQSVLRQVYLYGFTFLGGASLALWGAAAFIFIIIAKLVGADGTDTTADYIRQFILPGVGLLIGLGLLAYHWTTLQQDAGRRVMAGHLPATDQSRLSRSFTYIMSAVGLIALVPGLMALLGYILLIATADDVLTRTTEDAQFLAVAITMIIVGAPLWLVFWRRVVKADPTALIRRIYLYVILIALGGTWLFTLVTLIAAVLTEILGQGSSFLDETLIPSVSIVIPAVAFFVYHALVLRDDARRRPATPAVEDSLRTGDGGGGSQVSADYHIVPAPPYVVPSRSSLRRE